MKGGGKNHSALSKGRRRGIRERKEKLIPDFWRGGLPCHRLLTKKAGLQGREKKGEAAEKHIVKGKKGPAIQV